MSETLSQEPSAAYRCPEAQCDWAELTRSEAGLSCANGHVFPFSEGTSLPVFAKAPDDANEYSIQEASTRHDNALRWVFSTFGTDEESLRRDLISRLGLAPGTRVLITGAGTGNDLPFLLEGLSGAGEVFAQDIAEPMIRVADERHRSTFEASGVSLHLSVSDAMQLPFPADTFDAAYHFGGINLYPDIETGFSEMNRVVREGGKIVVGDEGVAPWLLDTEYGSMLIENNPLYACEVPLALLPETARDVRLTWELNHCFYVIEFNASKTPQEIDIDVPHVGTRGGTIRTRYFGQLEGIDPALRDHLYAEAERLGMSRVEYIEALLRKGAAE